MRIRKKEQVAGLVGAVTNSKSDSTTDTYSCAYINKLNTYSTEETFTGKHWIDGKKIYKKSINVGQHTFSNSVSPINHNIANVDRVTDINFNFYYGGYFYTDWEDVMYKKANETSYDIKTSSTLEVSHLVVTLEYTKTTD